MKANDEWRNDPERRQAWVDELKRRDAAMSAARDLVETALDELTSVGRYIGEDDRGGNAMWNRCIDDVRRASTRLHADFPENAQPMWENETYVGNMAAFGPPR